MPLYKEQGIVLRRIKLAEADRIVTIMTQGSGKIRAVAKGVRKTTSRIGARLEPFTHVSLLLYRGRGSLDTVSQVEILAAHAPLRSDYGLITAGEAMLEAVDKAAEEHERNVRLFLLLLSGLRALEGRPADPAAVAESFLLKLLSASGFHPSLSACAVCGNPNPELFASGQGGAVCSDCAEYGAGPVSPDALALLARFAATDLRVVGGAGSGDEPRLTILDGEDVRSTESPAVRREARAMLYGFVEYHLERRMRSLPMLARSGAIP